jgi:PleD family two-component response regulator
MEDVFVTMEGSLVHVGVMASLLTYNHEPAVQLIVSDITRRKEYEKELIYVSYHDQLTDLYNRRFFEEELKKLGATNELPVTVILSDVIGLKLINDSFGHAEGDAPF